MKTGTKILFLGIAGAAAYAAYKYAPKLISTARAAGSLMSDPVGVSVKSASLSSISAELKIQHTNPTKEPLQIQYIFIDVLEGANKIAEIRDTSIFDVPTENTAVQTVPFNVSTGALASFISKMASNPPSSLTVRGYIKANDLTVNIEKQIPFDGAGIKSTVQDTKKKVEDAGNKVMDFLDKTVNKAVNDLITIEKNKGSKDFKLWKESGLFAVLDKYFVSFTNKSGMIQGFKINKVFGTFDNQTDFAGYQVKNKLTLLKSL